MKINGMEMGQRLQVLGKEEVGSGPWSHQTPYLGDAGPSLVGEYVGDRFFKKKNNNNTVS